MKRKRLVKRHVSNGETAQQALAVSRADTSGLVDGVDVDFRHPQIPAGQWEAKPWWYVWAEGPTNAQIIFPSEGQFTDEELRAHKAPMDEIAAIRAEPGDLLYVEDVVDVTIDRRFDHLHDQLVKNAFLVLRKPDGTEFRPVLPLVFCGVTQLRDGPGRDAYDRLIERILDGNGDLDFTKFEGRKKARLGVFDPYRPLIELSHSERALIHAEEAERALAGLINEISPNQQAMAKIRMLLNGIALAGYFQAKHELRTAEAMATATKRNLEKGSEARRNKEVAEKAKTYWERGPTITRTAMAASIANEEGWGDNPSKLRWLMNALIPYDPNYRGKPKGG